MKLAIVHEVLVLQGGAERTLEVVHRLYPDAPIYTLLFDQARLKMDVRGWDIRPSSLQHHILHRQWRYLRPQMPTAIEQFDLRQYDVVLSSSSAFAHGVLTGPETLHISYYHAAMRFAWDYATQYLEEHNLERGLLSWYVRRVVHKLRQWDVAASTRPDVVVANSTVTKARLEHYYRRPVLEVIPPPVEVGAFRADQPRQEYFLVLSRLSPYKRVDLAVAACSRLKLPLIVVGEGPDESRLKQLAGPTVEFRGYVSEADKRLLLERAKGLIFPTNDDFGIVPVEAMAAGAPVIAYQAGGALETVKDGETGVFFREQTNQSVERALKKFNSAQFSAGALHKQAEQWDSSVFEQRLCHLIEECYAKHVG